MRILGINKYTNFEKLTNKSWKSIVISFIMLEKEQMWEFIHVENISFSELSKIGRMFSNQIFFIKPNIR